MQSRFWTMIAFAKDVKSRLGAIDDLLSPLEAQEEETIKAFTDQVIIPLGAVRDLIKRTASGLEKTLPREQQEAFNQEIITGELQEKLCEMREILNKVTASARDMENIVSQRRVALMPDSYAENEEEQMQELDEWNKTLPPPERLTPEEMGEVKKDIKRADYSLNAKLERLEDVITGLDLLAEQLFAYREPFDFSIFNSMADDLCIKCDRLRDRLKRSSRNR